MKLETIHYAMLSTLVIVFGSVIQLPNGSGGEEVMSVAHTISYTASSYLWANSLKPKKRYILLMAASIPLTEVLQLPLPYRNPCTEDLIANTVGVTLGYILANIPHSRL